MSNSASQNIADSLMALVRTANNRLEQSTFALYRAYESQRKPDGEDALRFFRKAVEEHQNALGNFQLALKNLTDFVLLGKIPDDMQLWDTMCQDPKLTRAAGAGGT